jgi:Putative lumazine-binding
MRLYIARLTAVFVLVAASQAVLASSLENALDAYVEGLRTGDMKTLHKLFIHDGQFCVNSGAEINCSSFAKAIPSWVAKPDPKTSGKIRSKEVIDQSMARVTYELDFNGVTYIDYLLLYRKNDQWIVVAKTTLLKQ